MQFFYIFVRQFLWLRIASDRLKVGLTRPIGPETQKNQVLSCQYDSRVINYGCIAFRILVTDFLIKIWFALQLRKLTQPVVTPTNPTSELLN